ncbi:MAG: hypothetical protein H6767_05345 [Candidatus Peribacteria bacterium]|nr:MAG: hypothetical protein H6767_05345 [Candidatus Peribacteria bacterium]
MLLSDTIGFIRDLPPELIDAFSSTLEDSIESDVLFHVVDASDPKIDEKIQVVDTILDTIHAKQPRIYVCNKIDLISPERKKELLTSLQDLNPVFVSSYSKEGFSELKQRVLKEIS